MKRCTEWCAVINAYGEYFILGIYSTKREAVEAVHTHLDIPKQKTTKKDADCFEIDGRHLVIRKNWVTHCGYTL